MVQWKYADGNTMDHFSALSPKYNFSDEMLDECDYEYLNMKEMPIHVADCEHLMWVNLENKCYNPARTGPD